MNLLMLVFLDSFFRLLLESSKERTKVLFAILQFAELQTSVHAFQSSKTKQTEKSNYTIGSENVDYVEPNVVLARFEILLM